MKLVTTLLALVVLTPFTTRAEEVPVTVEIKVPAMKCEGCAYSVTSNLKKLDNISAVYVDPKSKKALIEVSSKESPGKKSVYAAVKKSGFEGSGYRVLKQSFSAAKAKLVN